MVLAMLFTGPNCKACEAVKPKIESVCRDLTVPIIIKSADREKHQETFHRFGVRSIPTILIVDTETGTNMGYKVLDQLVGDVQMRTLKRTIKARVAVQMGADNG